MRVCQSRLSVKYTNMLATEVACVCSWGTVFYAVSCCTQFNYRNISMFLFCHVPLSSNCSLHNAVIVWDSRCAGMLPCSIIKASWIPSKVTATDTQAVVLSPSLWHHIYCFTTVMKQHLWSSFWGIQVYYYKFIFFVNTKYYTWIFS